MIALRLNDEGTTIRGTIEDEAGLVNISSATTKNFIFRKPNGSLVTKAGTFLTDGTDGILKYIFVTGDLDTIGRWEVEIQIALSDGRWLTNENEFYVD